MRFFQKNKQPDIPLRRRPTDADIGAQARSGPAFSYYSQRSSNSSNIGRDTAGETSDAPGRSRSAPDFVRHKAFYVFLAVLVSVSGVYLMILGTQPKVVLIQDKTTAYFLQDSTVYQQAAQQALSKSLFNRNKLTVDTNTVRQALLKNYPEIKNISLVLPVLGQQPILYIEPYKPSFILTTTNSNAFLLDSTGRALATTSQISHIDSLGVATIQDRSGNPVKLGSRALPSTTVSFTQAVVAALGTEKLTPSSLVLPPAAYELDVSIAGTPYFVKFNLQNDPLQQTGTYLATRQRLTTDHAAVGQYIDVRVPERAYYK